MPRRASFPALNLDTHMLVFAFTGSLSAAERKLLESHRWSMSSIVLWELAKLVQLGRISADFDETLFQRKLRGVEVLPISAEVAFISARLDFNGDPADEIIAATSVAYDVPLITRDQKILSSKLVPFA